MHLYPYVHKVDEYIHLPLVGRDKTCTKGMLLTNAALMEFLGLLTKAEKGLYKLGTNVKKRMVFLYGNALLVNFHNRLYDMILRKITQLGNKIYVETLLAGQKQILIQKGHFHQCMHQLGVIYTQFDRGFMQAFQLVNGVKKVNGDPVKGDFQVHNRFAIKLYKSYKHHILRRFLQMDVMDEISTMQFENNWCML
jgi:hypothetical protein